MAKIPRSPEVMRALRSLSREVKLATKEVNQQAAKRLSRGDYDGAQAMIEVAQNISAFTGEVGALQARWKDIRSTGNEGGSKKDDQTPLWEFYRPILQALVALDGEATRKQIESQLEGTIEATLKHGDLVTNARGVPRWRVMIRRARKPMIEEGFLSDEHKLRWIITKKGRQAAQRAVKGK